MFLGQVPRVAPLLMQVPGVDAHAHGATAARTMLHALEGDVDDVRHAFGAVATAANLGFYRNTRSQRIYGLARPWLTATAKNGQ